MQPPPRTGSAPPGSLQQVSIDLWTVLRPLRCAALQPSPFIWMRCPRAAVLSGVHAQKGQATAVVCALTLRQNTVLEE
jgi:hypothetical protein